MAHNEQNEPLGVPATHCGSDTPRLFESTGLKFTTSSPLRYAVGQDIKLRFVRSALKIIESQKTVQKEKTAIL